MNSTFLIEVLF